MIRIVPVGLGVGEPVLDGLAADLARLLRISCHVEAAAIDPDPAFDPVRGQYHATSLLRDLGKVPAANGDRLLGVTAVDLFVPIFTFVFGEAQVGGHRAIVSLHRLREEFYGLPGNYPLLRERLAKEAMHELGHTFGLRHCARWDCVMSSTHSVDRLDSKNAAPCPRCASRMFE